jgi:oligopeptide transport system substrate-binding protein
LYAIKNARAFHQGRESDPRALGFRVTDAYTLEVELERPVSTFLQAIGLSMFSPVPRHAIEKHGEAWSEPGRLVSNGPFVLEAYEPGKRMILARNPRYHGVASGNVERIELEMHSEEHRGGYLPEYQNGQLDVLDLLMTPTAEQVGHQSAEGFVSLPRLGTAYLAFNTRRSPLDDARVRRALALATDRDRMVNDYLSGTHFPATGGFTPEGIPGHVPGIALPFDPAQARQLLAEAGYPDGRAFPVLKRLLHGRVGDREPWKPEWDEHLGIGVEWDIRPESVTFRDLLNRGGPDLWLAGWQIYIPEPAHSLSAEWMRQSGWSHDEYEQLVQQGHETWDQEERLAIFRRAEEILVEEAPVLPLLYFRLQMLVQPWVRRFPTSPAKWWYWKDVVIEPH